MRFVPNPAFPAELVSLPATHAALQEAAKTVAAKAQDLGSEIDPDYQTDVETTAGGARVNASGGGINPASWIEFGTGAPAPTPAYAPLRRAIQSAGFKLRPSK